MKNKLTSLVFSAQKINRQHIQMVLMIVSLAMLSAWHRRPESMAAAADNSRGSFTCYCSWVGGWHMLGALARAAISAPRTSEPLAGLRCLPAAIHCGLSADNPQAFPRLACGWFSACLADHAADIRLAQPSHDGHVHSALRSGT